MEIIQGVDTLNLCVYIKKYKVLVLGDVHIGIEEALNKQGLLVPRYQLNDIMKELESAIKRTNPEYIVINGDLKHEFGIISKSEWRHTLKAIDFLRKFGKIVLLRGNHDKILGPIAGKRDIEVKDYFFINNIYICHGHIIPKNRDFIRAETVIIGHEHPAVSLRDMNRVEKYKCFLKGNYENKTLIVMPSFDQTNIGTDILSERLISPFLKKDIGEFEVYVIDREEYYFGRVKNLL